MTKELDALLTELYVLLDDHVVPPRTGRGRAPLLSDSELITLAVAQVLLGYHCERRWVRHLHAEPAWQALFPYLPQQSGLHRRLKNARPLLCKAIQILARHCPSWFDDLWMTDATPVPFGSSRETVKRSALAGHAGYGYCASHSRYYRGLKLYLVCTGDGMPIMWCLANPKLGEREVVAALLDHNHHLLRTGQILLADKGFAGREFKQVTDAMGLRLIRPDRRDETYTHGNLGGVRQWIESVNQTLKGQLDLERHGARTHEGVLTSGRLRFALGELAALPRAAVVVEDRYSQVFTLDRVRPALVADGLAELQVRWPMIPIVFCETRALAEEWTYRYLAAAAVWAETESAAIDRIGLIPGQDGGEDGGEDRGEDGTADAPDALAPSTAEVRAWARANGIEVPDRGRLRPEVHRAWRDAHRQ